jgi:hypothetical protein
MASQADVEPERSWSLLDGVTFVTGASVALVFLRDRVELLERPTPLGWSLLGAAFLLIALTSAGPFLYCVRRFGRRPPGYPGRGDRTWMVMGLPWLITGLVRSSLGTQDPEVAIGQISPVLLAGLACSSGYAVVVVVKRWRAIAVIDGEAPARSDDGPSSSTNAIGLALATVWPLQIALGWLVID